MDYSLKKNQRSKNKDLTKGKDAVECALLSRQHDVKKERVLEVFLMNGLFFKRL